MDKKNRELFQRIHEITKTDLEWGTKTDETIGWTPVEDRNIWCGELYNEVGLEIIGDEKSPDFSLMESALKVVNNLNHYLCQLSYSLGDGENEWQLISVNLLNKDDAGEIELELISYYGAGLGVLFRDGKIVREENHFDLLKRLIEKNLKRENCPDLDHLIFLSKWENYNHFEFQRLLFRNLDKFCYEDLLTVISGVWGNDLIVKPESKAQLKNIKIKTSSILKSQKIKCKECGAETETDLLFNLGECINYQEYNLYDEVRWGKENHGEKDYDGIYISAISPFKCGCGKEISTLIEYKENRLANICHDKAFQVEYGPWLGKSYITDNLIFLDEYKRIKSRELLLKITEIKGYEKNRIIYESLNLSRKYTMGIHPEKREAYCYQRYRNFFTDKDKENLDNFFELNFHNNSVKSACILKNVTICCGAGNECILTDLFFYWGSLLDFPEYNIGDSIRWSDYSMGKEKENVVYAVANPLNEDGGLRGIQALIEIRDNIIIGAEYLDSYYHKIKAYTGENKKRFLLWPDDKFMK